MFNYLSWNDSGMRYFVILIEQNRGQHVKFLAFDISNSGKLAGLVSWMKSSSFNLVTGFIRPYGIVPFLGVGRLPPAECSTEKIFGKIAYRIIVTTRTLRDFSSCPI